MRAAGARVRAVVGAGASSEERFLTCGNEITNIVSFFCDDADESTTQATTTFYMRPIRTSGVNTSDTKISHLRPHTCVFGSAPTLSI